MEAIVPVELPPPVHSPPLLTIPTTTNPKPVLPPILPQNLKPVCIQGAVLTRPKFTKHFNTGTALIACNPEVAEEFAAHLVNQQTQTLLPNSPNARKNPHKPGVTWCNRVKRQEAKNILEEHEDTVYRLRKQIKYLQESQQKVLEGLYQEIEGLRFENKNLNFQLVMRCDDVAKKDNSKTNRHVDKDISETCLTKHHSKVVKSIQVAETSLKQIANQALSEKMKSVKQTQSANELPSKAKKIRKHSSSIKRKITTQQDLTKTTTECTKLKTSKSNREKEELVLPKLSHRKARYSKRKVDEKTCDNFNLPTLNVSSSCRFMKNFKPLKN